MTREEALREFTRGVERARRDYDRGPIAVRGTGKPLCAECGLKPVRSKGRCDTCYRRARRRGDI